MYVCDTLCINRKSQIHVFALFIWKVCDHCANIEMTSRCKSSFIAPSNLVSSASTSGPKKWVIFMKIRVKLENIFYDSLLSVSLRTLNIMKLSIRTKFRPKNDEHFDKTRYTNQINTHQLIRYNTSNLQPMLFISKHQFWLHQRNI